MTTPPPDSRAQLLELIKDEAIAYEYYTNSFFRHDDTWLIDFRAIILNPKHLKLIIDVLYEEIADRDHYQIGGMESASIPLITALVERAHNAGKSVNGFYIRKSRNKNGLYKRIEGKLNNDPIVLVDDLINSAESIMTSILILEELEKKVDTVLVAVRFRPPETYVHLAEKHIELRTLFTLAELNLDYGNVTPPPKYSPYEITLLYDPGIASYEHVNPKSTPALSDTHVYFGTDSGTFLALDKQTGEKKWSIITGPDAVGRSIYSSPKVHRDTVYFGAYDGKFYALDAHTGKAKWLFSDCEWIGSSPAIADDLGLVFIGLEHGLYGHHGSVAALDTEDGRKHWEVRSGAYTHASPLYIPEHNMVCCGGNDGIMLALNAKTGGVLWKFETTGGSTYDGYSGFSGGDIKLAPVYDLATDSIAFCSMDGFLYVLNRTDGSMRYCAHTERANTTIHIGIYGMPLFTEKYVLFGGLDKVVRCIDKYTGKTAWTRETRGRIFSSPLSVSNSIFIGSNDGCLYEFEIDTGKTISKTQFIERITNPVVHDEGSNQLFIVTQTNQLFRLQLP